jgi:hypothetical protein
LIGGTLFLRTSMPPNLGDCYRAQSVGEPCPHLRIILTKPDLYGRMIVVIRTSWREGADPTTELLPGQHGLTMHRSFILYSDAEMIETSQLDEDIASGLIRLATPPFSGETLRRIQEGIESSPFTPRKIKREFKAAKAQNRL